MGKISIIIGLGLGVLLMCIVGSVRYNEQKTKWNNLARIALQQTLQNILTQDDCSVPFVCDGYMQQETPKGNEFKEVIVETGSGKDTLQVPGEKFSYNIEKSKYIQALYSFFILQDSLCMDSIYGQWKRKLSEQGFQGEASLGVRCLDLNTGAVATHTLPAGSLQGDSIAYFTLGAACELELIGWISLSWFQVLTQENGATGFLCFLAGMLPIGTGWIGHRLYRRHRAKKRAAEAEVPECVPVSEQDGHLELKDGTRLDPVCHTLQKDDKVVRLTPQSTLLLKTLLQAEEESLSQQMLLESLWSDGSGNNQRLYTAVSRLNETLKQLSTFRVRNENGLCCLREEDPEEEKDIIS